MKSFMFFLILLTVLLQSCDDNSVEPCNVDFEVTGYLSNIYKRVDTSMSCSETFETIKVDSNSVIKYSNFTIGLEALIEPVKIVQCDPIENILGNIKTINIQCNQDYNKNYRKNDTLNEIILMRYYAGNQREQICNPIFLINFLEALPSKKKDYLFFINEPPEHTGKYTFKIQITDSENMTYSIETYPIIIEL